MVDVVCGNYIGVLLGEFSWEVLLSILSLILLVNLSHMGLVPIWLKFIKRFRKGMFGQRPQVAGENIQRIFSWEQSNRYHGYSRKNGEAHLLLRFLLLPKEFSPTVPRTYCAKSRFVDKWN